MGSDADPGWGPAVPEVLLGLIPGWSIYRAGRRSRSGHGLTTLRVRFLSFVIGICLVGVVVLVLETAGGEMGSTAVGPVAGVVVVVGLASLAAPVLLGRSLPCESEAVLASGYRRWFFLQIACAEADALVAFVGYILSSVAWVYPAGVLFSAIGFARLAPTSRHLKRLQEDLSREGCQLSLMSALR